MKFYHIIPCIAVGILISMTSVYADEMVVDELLAEEAAVLADLEGLEKEDITDLQAIDEVILIPSPGILEKLHNLASSTKDALGSLLRLMHRRDMVKGPGHNAPDVVLLIAEKVDGWGKFGISGLCAYTAYKEFDPISALALAIYAYDQGTFDDALKQARNYSYRRNKVDVERVYNYARILVSGAIFGASRAVLGVLI